MVESREGFGHQGAIARRREGPSHESARPAVNACRSDLPRAVTDATALILFAVFALVLGWPERGIAGAVGAILAVDVAALLFILGAW